MTRNKRFIIFAAAAMLAVLTALPTDASAQRRRGGSVVRRPAVRTSVVVYRAPYYRSYRSYYAPYYWGWGGYGLWDYGWGGYYGRGSQYPYPYYPRYYNYEPGSDLRIQVTPKDAEVYLDGYLVGTVNDFDGVFQRLRVPYGEHAVAIYFQGYRTIEQKMLFRPGQNYQIKEVMQPAAAGDPAEPRPVPSATAPAAPDDEGYRPPMRGRQEPPMRGREEPSARGRVQPEMPPPGEARGDFGTLAIRVQPAGAEILIDGERWDSPAGDDRLVVDLAEGTHQVEVRKEGSKPYSAEVQVRRGRTSSLNVSLPKSN